MNTKPPSALRGQAMAEYVIVTLFCAIVLLAASSDGSAIDQLKSAFKSFFKAYSYAISVAPQSISP